MNAAEGNGSLDAALVRLAEQEAQSQSLASAVSALGGQIAHLAELVKDNQKALDHILALLMLDEAEDG